MAKKKKKNNKKKDKTKINKKQNKELFNITEVLIITILAIIFGWFMGTIVNNKSASISDSKEMQKLHDVYNTIVSNYYKKVDKKELIEASINGMLNYLDDPYTSYMDEKETETFNQIMDGEYKGVGISIVKYNEDIIITGIFKNSPAAKAGVKVGDIIKEVNGTSMEGKESEDVVKIVKKAKKVELKVKRGDEEKEFTMEPTKVVLTTVESEVIEKNDEKVGVISVSLFAANTSSQFKKELKKLEDEKIDSYIIDLRGNYGGYLKEATNIISEFMDHTHVIYQIKNSSKTTKYYADGETTKKYKVVILIDENSASAAEVVAAAFKDSYGSDIVGKKSYGKGTVQQTADLKGGGSIKFTTETWLTPKGKYINGNGIEPTVEVDLNEDYYDNPTNDNDSQLQRALEVITKSN